MSVPAITTSSPTWTIPQSIGGSQSATTAASGTEVDVKTAAATATTPQALLERVMKAFTHFEHKFNAALLSREAEQKNAGTKSYSISCATIFFSLGMLSKVIAPEKKALFLKTLGVEGMTETEFNTALSSLRTKLVIPLNANFKSEYEFQACLKQYGEYTAYSRYPQRDPKPTSITSESLCVDLINAIGVKQKACMQVDPSVIEHIKQVHNGTVYSGDAADKALNEWVKERTHGALPDFFDLEQTKDVPFLLVSAALVAAPWKKPFVYAKIGRMDFKLADGSVIPNTLIMRETVTDEACLIFRGAKDGDATTPFDMYEKPYLQSGLSRVIIVPHDSSKLADLEKTLTPEKIQACRKIAQDNIEKRKLAKTVLLAEIYWPMKTTRGDFSNLNKLLEKMGFPLDQFDRTFLKSDEPPSLTDMIHKSKVLDNHEGSVAFAANGSGFSCLGIYSGETFVFDAARPHFDLIMKDDMPLFRTHIADGISLITMTETQFLESQGYSEAMVKQIIESRVAYEARLKQNQNVGK